MNTNNKKAGRPRMNDEKRRDKTIVFRVNDQEHNAIEQAADGIAVGAFVRTAILLHIIQNCN